jgi:ankyrin repeat protein
MSKIRVIAAALAAVTWIAVAAPPASASTDPNSVLLRALIAGEPRLAAKALVDGADPNIAYASGIGGDPDVVGKQPVLDMAIEREDVNLVYLLLDNGADPNATVTTRVADAAPDTFSELMRAVLLPAKTPAQEKTVEDIVGMLLSYGAAQNHFNQRGDSAFSLALQKMPHASSPLLRVLLKRGVNPLALNPQRQTYLVHYLAETHDVDQRTLTYLLSLHMDPNVGDRNGRTPLMIAASRCDETTIAALRKAGASTEPIDGSLNNAVYYAMDAGCNPHLSALLLPGGQ